MARFPQSLCPKGSQRWMQWYVNHAAHAIDQEIGLGPIDWRSPLREDDYAEYRDAAFLDRIGVKPSKRTLDSFWPRGGPQWDALGRSSDGTVVMVEAKAHLNELYSPATSASAESSVALIQASLLETMEGLGVRTGFDWSKQFYQYANRIAHAYFLNALNDIPTKLVFMYFTGDTDVKGPSTSEAWQTAIETVHRALGLNASPSFVCDVFIDVTIDRSP